MVTMFLNSFLASGLQAVSPSLRFPRSSKLIQIRKDKRAIFSFSLRTAIVGLVVSGECEISLLFVL